MLLKQFKQFVAAKMSQINQFTDSEPSEAEDEIS